jgi:hypothetical protein
MKLFIIFTVIILYSCTAYAAGFGVSPGKLNLGVIETGKNYEKEIIFVNDNQDNNIKFFSSSINIKTENEIYNIKSNEKKKIKLIINIVDCTKKKNEDIIIASTEDDFGIGVGIKISYEIKGECEDNKITGLSIATDNKKFNYNYYVLYGAIGLLVLIFVLRKIIKKHIF